MIEVEQSTCTECGYFLIHDPGVICELGPICGDCGGECVEDCGCGAS